MTDHVDVDSLEPGYGTVCDCGRRVFKCFGCHEVFTSTWTAEAAIKEQEEIFGDGASQEESLSVCDLCHEIALERLAL